jgi:hypothetical protein
MMRAKYLIRGILVIALAVAWARADVKEDLTAAAKKLADSDNYSWTTGAQGPQGAIAGGGEGKIQRDRLTMLNLGIRGETTMIVFKDGKGAFQSPGEPWKSVGGSDATTQATTQPAGGGGGGDARMIANMIATYQPPAAQALNLIEKALELHQAEDGSIAGTLSADDAKALIQRRIVRGGGGGGAVAVREPAGELKFWASDGVLRKFQFHLTGKLDVAGQQRDIDRTTTIEIKDVGTTKIEVPDEAKAKMG